MLRLLVSEMSWKKKEIGWIHLLRFRRCWCGVANGCTNMFLFFFGSPIVLVRLSVIVVSIGWFVGRQTPMKWLIIFFDVSSKGKAARGKPESTFFRVGIPGKGFCNLYNFISIASKRQARGRTGWWLLLSVWTSVWCLKMPTTAHRPQMGWWIVASAAHFPVPDESTTTGDKA